MVGLVGIVNDERPSGTTHIDNPAGHGRRVHQMRNIALPFKDKALLAAGRHRVVDLPAIDTSPLSGSIEKFAGNDRVTHLTITVVCQRENGVHPVVDLMQVETIIDEFEMPAYCRDARFRHDALLEQADTVRRLGDTLYPVTDKQHDQQTQHDIGPLFQTILRQA